MQSEDPTSSASASAVAQLAAQVYGDIASPAAKRLGASLETLFKIGLSPIQMLDWGFERSKDWLAQRLRERSASIPPEHRVVPNYSLAVAAISGISAAPDQPAVCEMFAELLMKAMDDRTASLVHPAHPVVLTQMTPQEALVLLSLLKQRNEQLRVNSRANYVFVERSSEYTSSCTPTLENQFSSHCKQLGFDNAQSVQVWLDNLLRLELLRVESASDASITGGSRWEDVEISLNQAEYRFLTFTSFGEAFINACDPTRHSNAP